MARSDSLDPGMGRHDPELGWSLNPFWKGRHRHHDFEVEYSLNGSGFRGPDFREHKPPMKSVAVVGDSFTFGFGVNDDETFLQLLNRNRGGTERFYNFAIPGFSTDQELLVVERDVLRLKPDRLLLVVYLANDLFDNQLPMPLQGNRAKPHFVLAEDRLHLTNTPVPLVEGDRRGRPSLEDMVLGENPAGASLRLRLEAKSHLIRSITEPLLPPPDLSATFERRFDSGLRLFWALAGRMQQSCTTNGTRFGIVLMPGASFVEKPASLSGQFQEYFRRRLSEECARRKIGVIDVALELRQRHRRQPEQWFHPNEGHMNAQGHSIVAEILDGSFTRTWPEATNEPPPRAEAARPGVQR